MTEQKLKRSRLESAGWGCAVLFGLPFATGGAIAFGVILLTMYHDFRMQFWREAPCVILATELKEDHAEGTTYRTTAKYRYEYENKTYESTSVDLTYGKDNVGDFHQRVHRELKLHQETGQAFRCFVNPSRPSEAILYREARWETMALLTMFAIMFGGVGWGVLAGTAHDWWMQRTNRETCNAPSLKPWEQREDWRNNEIRYSDKKTGRSFFLCAVVGLVITAPALFTSSRELMRFNNPFAFLGFIPTGLSLLLLYGGLHYFLRWQRFGDSVLQLSTLPGVIGGSLVGAVQVDHRVKSPDGFLVCLVCTETSGTGDSETKKVMWEDERTIIRDMNPELLNNTAIPVRFDIPCDCLESKGKHATQLNLSQYNADNVLVVWKLTVVSLTEGVGYYAEFEVPVFRTVKSSQKH